MAQLLLTIDFMTRKGVIHRDIKPENILLNSKEPGVFDIRLADFGFATVLEAGQHDTISSNEAKFVCGTPGYIPPEAIQGKGYSRKSDIFSAGSIFFSILTLKNLFYGKDYNTLMLLNKKCDLSELETQMRGCSLDAKNLCRQLLNPDPTKRISATQALKHTWFAKEKNPLRNSMTLNKIIANKMGGSVSNMQSEVCNFLSHNPNMAI